MNPLCAANTFKLLDPESEEVEAGGKVLVRQQKRRCFGRFVE